MKIKVFFLIAFISFTANGYSQIFVIDEVKNNVRELMYLPKTIKLSDKVNYCLTKYIGLNGVSQYFIYCYYDHLTYHNFPNNSKLLFKTFDNKIVELTSIYSDLVPNPENAPFAYFPITQEQLETLFTGISKIRIEILSYDHKEDKPFVEYPELEYKKDKIGKVFQTMYTYIEKKSMKKVKGNKKNQEKTLERKINNSDF